MKKLSFIVSILLIIAVLLSGCVAPADTAQDETTLPEVTTAEATTEPEPEDDGITNVMIFGDSYSTFEGYIPKTYKSWYTKIGREGTDVKKVEETWWYQLCEQMDYNLVVNDSYSGSTIGYTGYDEADTAKTTSFIYRLENYEKQNFFEENEIDIIFVFGGTNDSWANAPLGEFKTEGITKNDLYNVLPAIPYFIGELKRLEPNAEIVFILNTDLKPEIGDAAKKTAEHYGTKCIELTTFQKRSSHPSVKGMASIASQVRKALS